MASEKVLEKVSTARKAMVDTIIDLIENKGINWVSQFDSGSMTPKNGATNTSYHGVNRIHLMCRAYLNGYEDNRWFTYKQASTLQDSCGERHPFFPRKGEKGSLVEYWEVRVSVVTCKEDDEEVVKHVHYPKLLGVFYVFNAEQLIDADGNPMPSADEITYKPNEDELRVEQIADKLIASSRCAIKEDRFADGAYFSPTSDSITIPDRKSFTSINAFATTLTHEMTHSTMIPLGRTEGMFNAFGSAEYAFEELVAELGSTFICSDLGVHRVDEIENDVNFTNHAAYLESWLHALKNNPDYLFKAASKADAAVKFMTEFYNKANTTVAAA